MTDIAAPRRYFASYTGIKLPLQLVSQLDENGTDLRMTYFTGHFDAAGRLLQVDKIVYGEIEFSHRYEYRPDGGLVKATLTDDDGVRTLMFDGEGRAVEI